MLTFCGCEVCNEHWKLCEAEYQRMYPQSGRASVRHYDYDTAFFPVTEGMMLVLDTPQSREMFNATFLAISKGEASAIPPKPEFKPRPRSNP